MKRRQENQKRNCLLQDAKRKEEKEGPAAGGGRPTSFGEAQLKRQGGPAGCTLQSEHWWHPGHHPVTKGCMDHSGLTETWEAPGVSERSPGWEVCYPSRLRAGRESTGYPQGVRPLHGQSPCGLSGYCWQFPAVPGDSLSSGSPGLVKLGSGVTAPAGACPVPTQPGLLHPGPAIRPALWPLPRGNPCGKPLPPCGHPGPSLWSPLAGMWGLAWPVLCPREQASGLDDLGPRLEPGTQPGQMDFSGRACGQQDTVVPTGSPICLSPQRERNGAASRRGSG